MGELTLSRPVGWRRSAPLYRAGTLANPATLKSFAGGGGTVCGDPAAARRRCAGRARPGAIPFLADAKSSLGDAKSSLGDAKSSLGDAKSSLGDAKSSLGDTKSSLGDAKSSLG